MFEKPSSVGFSGIPENGRPELGGGPGRQLPPGRVGLPAAS